MNKFHWRKNAWLKVIVHKGMSDKILSYPSIYILKHFKYFELMDELTDELTDWWVGSLEGP